MRVLKGMQAGRFLKLSPSGLALGSLLICAVMSSSSFADTQSQADKNVIDFAASQKNVETAPASQPVTIAPPTVEKQVEQPTAVQMSASSAVAQQTAIENPVQAPVVPVRSNAASSNEKPVAQSAESTSNDKPATESMTVNLILAGVAALLAIFVCRATITIGFDYAVLVPTMAFVTLVASFFIVGGNSPIWRYFWAVYWLAAGSLATIYARNHVMGWFANSSFVYVGANSRDLFWKQIGHRFGIEALAVALGLGLGWCGGFLLGLLELKKLKSKTQEAQSQNA